MTDCSKDLETSVVLANYLPDGITLAENTEEVMVKVIVAPHPVILPEQSPVLPLSPPIFEFP